MAGSDLGNYKVFGREYYYRKQNSDQWISIVDIWIGWAGGVSFWITI